MYWRPWTWSADQWLGGWVASATAAVIAEVGFAINAPLITAVGLSGLLLAWLVAGRYADRVLAGRSFVVEGLGVGLRTGLLVLAVWFVVSAALTMALNPESFDRRLVQVVLAAFGVPVYGSIFGMPFALLGGIAGALVLRAVRRFGDVGVSALAIASLGLAGGGAGAVAVLL